MLPLSDFATEPSEQQLRSGAHLMIANLAGSLALVTCKEPLRVSISNHLRAFLLRVTQDQTMVEQIVQVCANDNLELGCMLIEKAASERAIRDIDEGLTVHYQARRTCRETNQPFVDLVSAKPGAKYPRDLPDALKPNMGGLHSQQLMVYEGFQRQRAIMAAQQAAATAAAQQTSNIGSGMVGAIGGAGLPVNNNASALGQGLGGVAATGAASAPPSLTMSQVIRICYQRLIHTSYHYTLATHPSNAPC